MATVGLYYCVGFEIFTYIALCCVVREQVKRGPLRNTGMVDG